MNIAQLRTDEAKSTNGKWFDFTDGVSFLIAANNNPKHSKALSKIAQQRARAFRKNKGDEAERLFIDSLPGNVLLGWKGLKHTVNGEEIEYPYSDENAAHLLKTSREVKDFVVANANDLSNFAADEEAAAASDLKS